MIYQRIFSIPFAVNPEHQLEIIDIVRNRLVNAGILITVIFAIPVIPLTTLRALHVGWQAFMYLPLGLLCVMIVTALLRHRLSYYLRTFIFLGSWFVLGIGCLITWGLVGMGLPFLITLGIVGVILLGYRFGIIAIVASVLVSIIVCAAVLSGQIRFNFDVNAYVISPYSWLTAILAVGVFPAIVVFGLGQLHSSLIDSIYLLSKRSSELKEANEKLQEVNAQCLRVEKDLIESAAFSRSLIETAPSVILYLSPDKKIIDFNIEAERLTGKSKKDVIGKDCFELFVPEDAREIIENDMKKVLGGEPTRGFENEFIAHDGSLRILSWNVNRLVASDGQPIGIMAIGQDVTELKETEAALRSERDRLKTLVDGLSATGIGVDIINLNHEILEQNQFLAERFGKPDGKKCYELYMDSEEPCCICSMEKAVRVGHVERSELRGGDGRDYEIISSPLKNEAGVVDKAIEVIHDITERKRGEQALYASEEKFRTLVANIPGVVYRCKLDEHWTMFYISEMIEKISGYPASDFIENQVMSFASIIHPEDREAVKEITFEQVGKGRPFSLEYRIVTSDGNTRWIFEKGRGIRDENGDVNFLDGAIFDVTERKEAEKALKVSEANYRSIFNSVNDAIFVHDIESGRILQVNEKVSEILGYTKQELLQLTIEDISLGEHPYTQQEAMQLIRKTKEQGPQLFEWILKDKNGKTFWAEISLRAAFIEGVNRVLAICRDITKRKNTQQALAKSEERLSMALDAANEGLWDWNIKTQEVHFSPRYYTMLDYEPDEFPPSFEAWANLIHPDRRQATVNKVYEHVRRKSEKFAEEFPLRTKTGQWRWILSRGKVVQRDEKGESVRMVGTHVDITERKQAERALQESETTLHAIFDHHYQLTGLLDRQGRLLAANRTALEFIGADESEVVGHYFWKTPWWDSSQQSEVKSAIECAARGQFVRFETTHRTVDAQVRNFDFSLSPILDDDGNVVYIVPEGRDITKMKQSELALRQSEEFARAALNATTEMMFLAQPDGQILMANETGARSLGKSPNELVGMNVFNFFPPDVAKQRKEQGYKVARSGKPVRYQDEREGRFFDISIYPTFDSEGKVDRLAIFVADITKRKLAEQDREKLLRTLAVKNEELESILYASSHDLKSPMVNIQGFSWELNEQCRQLQQLLEKKVSLEEENELMTIVNQTIPETLNFITAGSARLNSLLDGLLKVSRINRADMQIRLLDMNKIIEQIQQTITYQIKQKNISFTVEALPVCYGDHLLTGRVFANIIDNALKYLDPVRNGKIHISGWVEKNTSVYCVEDNGIGIAEEHKKLIFDLFYRLNPEDGIEGEGVGLTMVKRILQNQNGNIRLESELGKGSRFYVSLPNSLI